MRRRDLLLAAGIGASVPGFAFAQSTDSDNGGGDDDLVEYLFVQASANVSLQDGTLRLENVNPRTVYFSDRPDRLAGVFSTQDFVDQWSTGSDNFQEDPPNAVLILHEGDQTIGSAVVLHDPQYADGTLTYTVDVIDGQDTLSGGWSSLFIDVIGRPATPLSYAGVARRTTRRTVRRLAY